MKNLIIPILTLVGVIPVLASSNRQDYSIKVDKNGVMYRSDTKEKMAYYGTNYTLPFAHAWRATGSMGLDRKAVADRDIYHMKRLGLNAFRLHLWDVELSDSIGNLLDNDHLDLLDYMIAQLEKEGIDIILTAQTNFGNGYPEKNIDTGAFSYDYDKCSIHENTDAQAAQERYLTALAHHRNPYTGLTYGQDKGIIAIEINNEPCHSGTPKQVTEYINRMVKALRKGGFDRIVLYNVSHNPEVTKAYYDANIQGTTYQWYPDGLVAGHERKGNFLPYVEEYPIPWKNNIPNFSKMSKVVYEFDPGDVLTSYLYPAIARTFRKEGFQWATQFAYDPTPLAPYNTEYQTHYLNLLYTPSKALSMAVAAEVMKDTTSSHLRINAVEDLSEYNSSSTFLHTRSTTSTPKDISSLQHIAGVGNSPIVSYTGNGAYFLDRLEGDVWRLEVMPDAVIVSDPFEKPTLSKEVARLYFNPNTMTLSLPSLGDNFYLEGITKGEETTNASHGTITVTPGVYLLARDLTSLQKQAPKIEKRFAAAGLTPNEDRRTTDINHTPKATALPGEMLEISAEVFSDVPIESVKIYPSSVSFWREDNPIITMEQQEDGRKYTANVAAGATSGNSFNYNIVVFTSDGKTMTWPQAKEGTPLDWDFTDYTYYTTRLTEPESPIILLRAQPQDPNMEVATVPDNWSGSVVYSDADPEATVHYEITPPHKYNDENGFISVRRYIGEETKEDKRLSEVSTVNVLLAREVENPETLTIALTDKNGLTYSAPLSKATFKSSAAGTIYSIALNDLEQTPTAIIPAPYPTFLPRFAPSQPEQALDITSLDFVDLRVDFGRAPVSLGSIWLK